MNDGQTVAAERVAILMQQSEMRRSLQQIRDQLGEIKTDVRQAIAPRSSDGRQFLVEFDLRASLLDKAISRFMQRHCGGES